MTFALEEHVFFLTAKTWHLSTRILKLRICGSEIRRLSSRPPKDSLEVLVERGAESWKLGAETSEDLKMPTFFGQKIQRCDLCRDDS